MSVLTVHQSLLTASCVLASCIAVQEAQAAEVEAIFFFVVNEMETGEVYAVLRGDDVLVARSDLEAAGLSGFQAEEVDVRGQTLISLASVRPRLRFTVDEENVALRVHAPATLFPAQHIDMARAPEGISYASKPGAFFNYAPHIEVPSHGSGSAGAFLEVGATEQNRLYYSGATYGSEDGFTRGLTSVNFDDRAKMRRLTLGDMSVSTGAIGGSMVLGGITLARDFKLDPYFSKAPSIRFASSTDTPSTVDVYINGIRTRSETLRPGEFTLDNLRNLAGSGTVRYVVRDALGAERSYTKPYYVGPSLLAKGIEDYALSAGLPRSELGRENFSYLGPAVLGYYRRGVLKSLTLGGRGECRWDRVSGGPVVSTATPAGSFELETGASAATNGQKGVAGVFSYQFISRRFNAQGSLRVLSKHYATASLAPEVDRSLGQLDTTVSVPVWHRASFVARNTVDVHRDLPTFARVSGLTQIPLTREFLLSAEVAIVTLAPPSSSWESYVSLSWSPDSGIFTSAAARSSGEERSMNLQVNRPATAGQDWSMYGALDVGSTTRSTMRSRLQTPTNVFTTTFSRSAPGAALSFEPAGGVVWVEDGGVFLTRPIHNSFGLVRVPGVEDVRVYASAQEVGKTDEDGYAIVPNMSAHQASHISIESDDVPLEYDLEEDKKIAAAPRRGAAYVEFPVQRVQYFRGRLLLVENGAETEPIYGEFVVAGENEEKTSGIGDGGTFELEGLAPGEHEATIFYEDAQCAFRFDVPAEDAMLVDLGVLRCQID